MGWGGQPQPSEASPTPPPYDIPSGCCFFTGPWTVTRSSLRMLRRGAAFCRPLRPVLLLVSFPRSRSPVVGVLGLCWMWRDVPLGRQRAPSSWRIGGCAGCRWGRLTVFAVPPPPRLRLCEALPSPAWEGRQGADAALEQRDNCPTLDE